MRFSIHGGFLLLISVLQATLLNYIEILNVKPNLFLVYILILGFFCGKTEGAVLGGIYGFILDVMIGRFLGMNALMFAAAGYFTAYFCEKILGNKNAFIILLYTVVVSIFYELIYHLFSFLIIGDVDFIYALKDVILIECIYNGFVAFLLYPLLRKLTNFMYADKGENIG